MAGGAEEDDCVESVQWDPGDDEQEDDDGHALGRARLRSERR